MQKAKILASNFLNSYLASINQMIYKHTKDESPNAIQILSGQTNIYTVSRSDPLDPMHSNEPRKKNPHFELQSLFMRLFSTDDKLIILQYIRDEIRKTENSLYPSFQEGQILAELINIFSINNLSYSILLIQIFQNLLQNDGQFALYISLHNDFFFSLSINDKLQSKLFALFAKVIEYNPEFSDYLHSQEIITKLFGICDNLQNNDNNTDLIQSIALLLKSMIKAKKLLSNYYQTDESKVDATYKLISITHSLSNYLEHLITPQNQKKTTKSRKSTISKEDQKKQTEQYLETILQPILLLLDSICYANLTSLSQLIDDSIGSMISFYLSKGKYVDLILNILNSMSKNFKNEADSFLDNFDLVGPLKRIANNKKWEVIEVLINYAKWSPSNSKIFNDYEFLQLYEIDSVNKFSVQKKKQLFTLFCTLASNIPSEIIENEKFQLYLQDSMDLCVSEDDEEFNLCFMQAILVLLNLQDFNICAHIDSSELGEIMENYSLNSPNNEVIALSREILSKIAY